MKITELNVNPTRTRLTTILEQSQRNGKISAQEVYDILSSDNEEGRAQKYFSDAWEPNGICSIFSEVYLQGLEEAITNDTTLRSYYGTGGYLHISYDGFSKEPSNERMIINIDTQQNAVKLCKFLFEKNKSVIGGLKFLWGASNSEMSELPLKTDKIVIYYNNITQRNAIYETITSCGIESSCFSNALSAFYDIYTNEDGKYPVGIAAETDPTNSFTMIKTHDIMFYLTGVDIFNIWDEAIALKSSDEFKIDQMLETLNEGGK